MSDYVGEIHLLTIVCYIWNLTFAALVPFKIYTNFIHFLNENPLNLQKMFNVLKQNSHCEIYDFSHAIYNYKLTQQFQSLFNNYTNSNKIVSIEKHFIKYLILHHFQYAMGQPLGYISLYICCDLRINEWQYPYYCYSVIQELMMTTSLIFGKMWFKN